MNKVGKYKNEELTETELYKKLGELTKNKDKWEACILDVAVLLKSDSKKIQAKALWLLGEMGLQYPDKISDCVAPIVTFLQSPDSLLRERALNALGAIKRPQRYDASLRFQNPGRHGLL